MNHVLTAVRTHWIPAIVAALLAVTGLAYLVRGVGVPAESGRVDRWLNPLDLYPIAGGLMLPVGVAFLVLAPALWGRRRRAWVTCMVLFALLALIATLWSPSMLVVLATWGTLALLLIARDGYVVPGDRPAARTPRAVYGMLLGALACAALASWLTMGRDPGEWSWSEGSREAVTLLVAATAPVDTEGLAQILAALTGLLGLVSMALLARAALAAPAPPPDLVAEPGIARALEVVRAHGADSLSFFTLRPDVSHVWAPDGKAFAAVRREPGVLLVSGDPVGPEDSIPSLLATLEDLCRREGVPLAAVGADEAMCAVYRERGMHRIYMGDEAIVFTERFTLTGRPIRKVRQSVNRIERAGFTFSMQLLGDLDPTTLDELREISRRWLRGEPERGFSMALDDIGGRHQRDTWVAIARDGEGVARGFLQFVPAGGDAASLSFMRRDPDTPNGLSEFLVARSLEWFRDAGIARVSLNFAAFGGVLRDPRSRGARLFAAVLRRGDRYFQLERLMSFNEKFFPEWQPRYLVYGDVTRLPSVVLGCLWAEGQLPRPPWHRRRRAGRPG